MQGSVIDFYPDDGLKDAGLTLPEFPAVEFKKLAFQKKKGDFKHMHSWSDSLMESSDYQSYI